MGSRPGLVTVSTYDLENMLGWFVCLNSSFSTATTSLPPTSPWTVHEAMGRPLKDRRNSIRSTNSASALLIDVDVSTLYFCGPAFSPSGGGPSGTSRLDVTDCHDVMPLPLLNTSSRMELLPTEVLPRPRLPSLMRADVKTRHLVMTGAPSS